MREVELTHDEWLETVSAEADDIVRVSLFDFIMQQYPPSEWCVVFEQCMRDRLEEYIYRPLTKPTADMTFTEFLSESSKLIEESQQRGK